MKLCQHPSIQREAPEQELSGASFFRTCISLCASEAVFGRRRERRSITRRPRRCPNLCLRGRYFSSFPCRRAGRLRVVAQHVFFYCGVDVQEGFSTASNGAAALKKPPCPKLCFCAAVFCVFRAAAISDPILRRGVGRHRRRRHHASPQRSSLRCSAKAEVLWRPRAVLVGAFIGAPETAVFVPLRRWSSRQAFFATFRAAPTPGRFNCAAGWGKKV